jgi:peptide/nickel transport system substrate-binding protein
MTRFFDKAITLAVAATALAGTAISTPAFAQKAANTVRFAYDQAPESVDPFFNNVRIGVIIGANVWDTLIYRDPATNEYKGQLAKSWKQVDDKTIEFELREGVKFHNGEEFDADDVVYTLNFIAKPENKVVTQGNVNWIAKAEKLDKYKVRLITKEVFPAAIEYLAGPVVIHPNEYYEKVGPKGQNEKPVGSGPYRVANHVPGKSITLELNRTTSRLRRSRSRRSARSRSASSPTARPRWPRCSPAAAT